MNLLGKWLLIIINNNNHSIIVIIYDYNFYFLENQNKCVIVYESFNKLLCWENVTEKSVSFKLAHIYNDISRLSSRSIKNEVRLSILKWEPNINPPICLNKANWAKHPKWSIDRFQTWMKKHVFVKLFSFFHRLAEINIITPAFDAWFVRL